MTSMTCGPWRRARWPRWSHASERKELHAKPCFGLEVTFRVRLMTLDPCTPWRITLDLRHAVGEARKARNCRLLRSARRGGFPPSPSGALNVQFVPLRGVTP